jgi:hypothetical protein
MTDPEPISNQKETMVNVHYVLVYRAVIWDITPCSPLKINLCFGETYRLRRQCRRISQTRYLHEAGNKLAPCIMLVSCLAYSSTLKMEATCSSEMSGDVQWTTWRHVPEDSRCLHNHRCDNLKSCIVLLQWHTIVINLKTQNRVYVLCVYNDLKEVCRGLQSSAWG